MWVTEIGFSTHQRARNPVSEFRQAALLADLYRSLRDESVVAVLVHRLRDADAPNPAERGYGVIRASGERKPAFCALVAQFSAQRPC